MKKIICIGSATKDIFVSLKETVLIDTSENIIAKELMGLEFGAKIYAEDFKEEVGGSAVNVATGLSLSGVKSFVFSRTSRSENGKWILKRIAKRKLKKNYMQQTGGVGSEISVIINDRKNKDHVILRTGDSIESFDIKKAFSKFREKADAVFVGSQKNGWEKRLSEIISFAKKKKAILALNPSSYQIERYSKELFAFLEKIDILFLNKDEAIELVKNACLENIDDASLLANKILDGGCRIVVITEGSKGAYVANKSSSWYSTTCSVDTVDTTGAGDAFLSGFLSSYVRDKNIQRALAWGLANGAGAVSVQGATKGLCNEKELKIAEKKYLRKIK